MEKKKLYNFAKYEEAMKIAARKDCGSFLGKYERLKDLSYKTFATIWKEMSFSLVYAGVKNESDVKEFTEIMFAIAKKYLIFPNTIYTQVGALYLLYGLYYKQPYISWVKIRLTYEDFQFVTKLIDKMEERNQLEPVFIFTKLKLDNAFAYVAKDKPLGLQEQRCSEVEPIKQTKLDMIKSKYKYLVNKNKSFKNLILLEDEYKATLQNFPDTGPPAGFSTLTTNISQNLKQLYESLDVGATLCKEEAVNDNVAARRELIKRKAVVTHTETSRTKKFKSKLGALSN